MEVSPKVISQIIYLTKKYEQIMKNLENTTAILLILVHH